MGLGYNAQLNIEPTTIPLSRAMDLCVVFMSDNRVEAFKTHAAYARDFIKQVSDYVLILDSCMGVVYESDKQREEHKLQLTKLNEHCAVVQDGPANMLEPASFSNGILFNTADGSVRPYTNDDRTCPMIHEGLQKSSMINWVLTVTAAAV